LGLASSTAQGAKKLQASKLQHPEKLQTPSAKPRQLPFGREPGGFGQVHLHGAQGQLNSNEFKPFQMISNEFKPLFKKIINHQTPEPHEKLRAEI
jgi:hypothetical protein